MGAGSDKQLHFGGLVRRKHFGRTCRHALFDDGKSRNFRQVAINFETFSHSQDYEHLGRAFCETLMDYYDDNPLKVNNRNNLLTSLKQTRKVERKARKALKAQRMAEKLIEQEKQHEIDIKLREISEKEQLKTCEKFSIRDQFNWDELEEDLKNENLEGENENDEGYDEDD